MPSNYINPKCPDCGRCIDVHYDEQIDSYYCPSNSCQNYWASSQVRA